jgi:oligoribonuclease NrnB/cAMP/cGMP phosphodiesterase (DHH superfamily)
MQSRTARRESMKHLIIYHAHCNDGFGAAWAAWKALKETGLVELYPASYGQEPPYELMNAGVDVHIVDFSYPPDKLLTLCSMSKTVTMLDHHKTAIEAYAQYASPDEPNCTIVFDTARSGAQLAWDYYHPGKLTPRLIAHIQDRDLWKKELDYTEEVHLNLSTLQKDLKVWDLVITNCDRSGFEYNKFVEGGAAIKRYYDQLIQNILATNKVEVFIDGVRGLSCNCPGALASDMGNLLAKESGTYGLTWEETKDAAEKISLRSIGDYDVASIAKSFGGGGHLNAAGFTLALNDDTNCSRIKFKKL